MKTIQNQLDRDACDRASETTGAGKLSRDYYRAISFARAFKADHTVERERAVRLYSTQFGQAWELQVRCPLGVGPFGLRDGKDFIIAGASLGVSELKELRDAIDAMLRDCGATS